MRIRETGVLVGRWKDDGRQWPHEAPGAAVLRRSMMGLCERVLVCALRASEILLASFWHSLFVCLLCSWVHMIKKNSIELLEAVRCLWLALFNTF